MRNKSLISLLLTFFLVVTVIFFGSSFSVVLAGSVDTELNDMILSSSNYIAAKGIKMVTSSNILDASRSLIEKVGDDNAPHELKVKIINKLAMLDCDESLSGLILIGQNFGDEADISNSKLSKKILESKTFLDLTQNVNTEIESDLWAQTTLLTASSPRLSLADVIIELLRDNKPPLIHLAALSKINFSNVSHEIIADRLISLSKSKLVPVRAYAFRAITLLLPPSEISDFILSGLKDESVVVKDAILTTVIDVLPPGLDKELAGLVKTESNPDIYNKIGLLIDAYEQTYLLSIIGDLCYVGGIVLFVILLAMIPLFLKWKKQAKFKAGG